MGDSHISEAPSGKHLLFAEMSSNMRLGAKHGNTGGGIRPGDLVHVTVKQLCTLM